METILVLVAVFAAYSIFLYNRLVALRQTRKNAFSDIDVQLKQRYNLVPQLVDTVKGYAKHEKETFENVTAARAGIDKASQGSGPDAGRIKAENALGAAMMNLFAVAENYPDLKADQNFQRLMSEGSGLGMASRRMVPNTDTGGTTCPPHWRVLASNSSYVAVAAPPQ